MGEAEHEATHAIQAEYLPVWWRCVLVAMATLILCSCSSPAMRTHLSRDKSLLDPAPTAAISARQLPALSGVSVADDAAMPNYLEPPAPPGAVSVGSCQACQRGANGYAAINPYAPFVGPSDEYLCDGGDYGTPAGVKADRSITGLEPEDAVSHYDTVDGRVLVTPSNRVCIYAPRFAAVRRVVEAAS